jgi:hypothetical protein
MCSRIALFSEVLWCASVAWSAPESNIRRQLDHLWEAQAVSETAVENLVKCGIESLRVFYAQFEQIDHMDRYCFRARVVPRLPAEEASRILLAEFRERSQVGEAAMDLARREKAGEPPAVLEAQFAPLEESYNRWRWTLDAMGNLGYPAGYDEVFALYVRHAGVRGMLFHLTQAL